MSRISLNIVVDTHVKCKITILLFNKNVDLLKLFPPRQLTSLIIKRSLNYKSIINDSLKYLINWNSKLLLLN